VHSYSIHYLNPFDITRDVLEVEDICDEVAISAAKRTANGQLFELWHRDRLVFRDNVTPIVG
jgi:hypothetical protein